MIFLFLNLVEKEKLMNFFKKNALYIVIVLAITSVFLIPSVREKITDQFFPVATVQSASSFTEADLDVQLKGINVASTNLKNLKGKTVFLNFWGTWCPPCREEWPSIQKLYESKNEKVDFVLIAMQDEEEKVREFLKTNNYTAPVYIAESPISDKILPKVFPTTYLLSGSGQILKKETSSIDWNSKEIHEFVDNVTP